MTTQTKNKIGTCLWFDDQSEEAANFYVSIFENASIIETTPYLVQTPSNKPIGSVMTVDFEVEGYNFVALNGGPYFKPNPSISFIVNCESEEEVDYLWDKLSKGGSALMPLDSYPFSDKYGWAEDKYGISWQLILSDPEGDWRPKITPSLLFVGNNCGKAEKAIQFYISIFDNAEIGNIARYGEEQQPNAEGTIMYGDFTIENQWFAVMDSAQEHDFNFTEGLSLIVNCDTQEEVDYFWGKMSADPMAEQCGWLKDKFGVSWQIVPIEMDELFTEGNTEKSKRTMEAMLQMKKLDIAELKRAYEEG